MESYALKIHGAAAHERPRPTSRLLASRPHAEAEVDDHPTRMERQVQNLQGNCRHPGCSEVETLGHVLDYCPKGELLRNNRHHKVRSFIATTLRKAKWEVYEEVHCLVENGSTTRADIIAIDRQNQRSLILDTTVHFEKDDQQANHINDEKKSIYNPFKSTNGRVRGGDDVSSPTVRMSESFAVCQNCNTLFLKGFLIGFVLIKLSS
ncbi:hypothetical protein ANN_25943 [Periplaneta americana]|uniref:Uncharacterized protein n=1 Tax=Periplaneta americana TaxID=6978 RepID=A0ABQ8S4X6_PERAM|nr:hypothetical protein ANN_25943 [Periplaneta americana]